MADYTIRIETDSAQAEKDLDRVDKKVKATTGDKEINVQVGNTNQVLDTLRTIGEATKTAFSVASLMPGFMDLGDILKVVGAGVTNVATGVASLPKDPGGIISTSFDLAGKSAEALTLNVSKVGFAIFGVTQSVNLLKAAYGRMFDETIGREIRLQEVLLNTKTAIVAVNDVFLDDKKITDPYKAIMALEKPLEDTLKNIRVRSLDIAGTTSDAVVQVFGVVSQQIGQFKGTLKDAEDLAISFAGALGVIGLNDPALATQEIRSILTGTIGPDSLLARTLGLTNEQVTKAKGSAEGLVAFLQKKLEAFSAGQKVAAASFSGVTSNIQEIREELSRTFGDPMLEPLLTGLTEVYNRMQMVVKPSAKLAETLGGVGAAIMGGTGRAIAAAPVLRGADEESSAKVFDAAQAQADRFSAYVKGQISELQSTITRLTQQMTVALAQLGQGLGALIKGFANFKFEGFKLMLNSLANLATAANSLLIPALNKILQLYGALLELPPIQYVAQYLTQWQALEQLQVLPMVRGIYIIGRAWGTVTAVLKGAFDAAGMVQKAAARAAEAIKSGAAAVADTLRTALSFVVRIGVAIAEMGVKIGASAIGGLGLLVSGLATVLSKVSLLVIAQVRKIGDYVLMEGTKILYRLISTIEGALVSLAPRIKGVLAGLAASLGNSPTMQPMVNAINSVIAALDRIPEAARRAEMSVEKIGNKARFTLDNLDTGAQKAAQGLENLGVRGKERIEGMRGPLANAVQNIRNFGTASVQALQRFDFGLGLVKKGLASLGAGIASMARMAGSAIKGLLVSLAGFYAWMLAFQVVTTLVMDLVGRYQAKQADTRSAATAAAALNDLQTKYKDVGESADFATKKAKENAEAIVAARYDQVAERLAQLNDELKAFDADASVQGINSIGEAWRGFQGAIWGVIDAVMNIGTEMDKVTVPVGRMTSGLRQLFSPLLDLFRSINEQLDKLAGRAGSFKIDKSLLSALSTGTPLQSLVQGGLAASDILSSGSQYGRTAVDNDRREAQTELDKLTAEKEKEQQAENFKLMSNNRLDLSKQVKEMERKNEQELHQLRMNLRGKEIEIFQAEQNLRLAQETQRVNKLLEGERGATRLVMQRIFDYLKTKKEGETSIEVARRKLVIETLNMEKAMANFKYDTELRIAELKKSVGDYEKQLADYKYDMAVKTAKAAQEGVAEGEMNMTGDTGLKMGRTGNSTGIHYHVEGAKSEAEARAMFAGGDKLQMTSPPGPRWGRQHKGWDFSTGDPNLQKMVLAQGYRLTKFEKDSGDGYGNKAYIERIADGVKFMVAHLAKPPTGWTMAAQGGVGTPANGIQGYARRLGHLESDNKWQNVTKGRAPEDVTTGFFQFKPGTAREAEQKYGVKAAALTSRNYGQASTALASYIQNRFPKAYEAIQRGDFATADKMLNKVWTSLPGGAESNPDRVAVANRLAGKTMGSGTAGPITAAPEPKIPRFPDIAKMMRGQVSAVEELNKQLLATEARLNAINAKLIGIKTVEAFEAITKDLFEMPDLQGMRNAKDNVKAEIDALSKVVGTAYDTSNFELNLKYSLKEMDIVRTIKAGEEAISKLRTERAKDGLVLSLQEEAKLRENIAAKAKEARDANAQALEIDRETLKLMRQKSLMLELDKSRRDLVFAQEKEMRDIRNQMQLATATQRQREDPVFMRNFRTEASIEDRRGEIRQANPGMTDAQINEMPEFKAWVEQLRKGAKELGMLEKAFQTLQKKLKTIEEIKEVFSGGFKNIFKAALSGGDIGSAVQQMSQGLADKVIGIGLDSIMKPFEENLERNLRKWMGIEEMKTPQEANTDAVKTSITAVESNVAALQENTAALKAQNNIVRGPGLTPEGGTGNPFNLPNLPPIPGTNPFGGSGPFLSGFEIPAIQGKGTGPAFGAGGPDFSKVTENTTLAFQNLDLGFKAAEISTKSYVNTLRDIPDVATQAAEGSNKFLGGLGAVATGALSIYGSLQQIGKGGTGNVLSGLAGIFGTISGLTGGGFGGLFGKRASGGPVMADRTYLVGEQGPELFTPGASGNITSNQDLFADTRATLDQQQQAKQTAMPEQIVTGGKIEVLTQTQRINSVDYVTAEQHQKGMQEAAMQGQALTLQSLQNSVGSRRRIGIGS